MKNPNLDITLDWLEKLIAFDTRNGTGDELACLEFLKSILNQYSPDELTFERVMRSRGKSDSGYVCLLYTSPSPRDATLSRMPSSA